MSTKAKVASPEFRLQMLRLMVRDSAFMRDCAHLIEVKDFDPEPGESEAQAIIAGFALDHWTRYHEPIDRLLNPELKTEAKLNGWGKGLIQEMRGLLRSIFGKRVIGAEYIKDNLLAFRKRLTRQRAIQEIIQLHETHALTDDKFLEICSETVRTFQEQHRPTADIYADDSVEARILRRQMEPTLPRYHKFFIKPLDDITVGIGRGHIGLVLAPYKRGKSLMLLWIAAALTVQGYNVVYFTLEDPLADVEDRLDALMSSTSKKDLVEEPETFRLRWQNWRRNAKAKLRVVDMRDIEAKVQNIEAEYERLRADGFLADVVIIDYDNLLIPDRRKENRKEELTALYRELVRWVAKRNVILWTASQTDANSEEVQKLGGKNLADDKGKLRHVTMAIGMGAPADPWPKTALYLHVAAHRNAPMGMGCHIIPDREVSRIYDLEKTQAVQEEIDDAPPTTDSSATEEDFSKKKKRRD